MDERSKRRFSIARRFWLRFAEGSAHELGRWAVWLGGIATVLAALWFGGGAMIDKITPDISMPKISLWPCETKTCGIADKVKGLWPNDDQVVVADTAPTGAESAAEESAATPKESAFSRLAFWKNDDEDSQDSNRVEQAQETISPDAADPDLEIISSAEAAQPAPTAIVKAEPMDMKIFEDIKTASAEAAPEKAPAEEAVAEETTEAEASAEGCSSWMPGKCALSQWWARRGQDKE